MTIRSRPSNDDYRREWERVFGEAPKLESREGLHLTGTRQKKEDPAAPLNPHDADEHPKAD